MHISIYNGFIAVLSERTASVSTFVTFLIAVKHMARPLIYVLISGK